MFDPRINAFRPDLADISLSHSVVAERYAESVLRQCLRGVVPLLAEPKPDAGQVSQIRYGEFLDVFEMRKDGFAWVQNRADRYVGYVPVDDVLSEEIADLSSRISALQTFVYPEPDLKSPPIDELTLGSYVRPLAKENGFQKLASGGYVFAKHIVAAESIWAPDYVFTAGRMLNTPYLWGSGLVQLALDIAGIDAPRDSDQQAQTFGQPLARHWRDVAWKRGDLVFFSGHVGIMTGPDHIIHASAIDMKVVVEPLVKAVFDRGQEITAAGRPEV